MLLKIKSFLKSIKLPKISVPAVFGKVTHPDQKTEIDKKDKYKVLDGIIKRFGKPKDDLLETTNKSRRIGLVAILIFFGFFGFWAAFAPLDGASIATGEIIAKSDKKIIQHLEGGIINELLVEEGDHVEKDQPLVLLNDTNAKTQVGLLTERRFALMATEARLIAERDKTDEIDFFDDRDFLKIDQSKRQKVIANQESFFNARKDSLGNQVRIITKKIDQSEKEVEALDSQLVSAKKQLELIKDDLINKKELFEKNIIDKTRLVALEKEEVSWSGKVGELEAYISRAEQRIAESELEILSLENRFNSDVINELKEINQLIDENDQRLSAAKDLLERSLVKSPQKGRVTGLRYTSVGGVIPSGATIMEITPSEQNMLVEAKIMPNNIEAVLASQLKEENYVEIDGAKGVATKVRLTAFSSRKVGLLNAVMTYVSADTILDPRTGMHYYLAYIKIPSSELDKMNAEVKLYPGMPAVAYITTESRTLLSYLVSPITSTFENAFKER